MQRLQTKILLNKGKLKMKEIALSKKNVKVKSLITLGAIITAVALPQLFHIVGRLSGMGTSLGIAFSPMHIVVFAAGLFSGPIVGLITGLVSPLVSALISGMPAGINIPLMIFELGAYGLFAGFFMNTKMPVIVRLLIAQVAGRVVRALTIIFFIYVLKNEQLTLSRTYNYILAGLPGLVLQWTILPLLMYRFNDLQDRINK